MFCLDYHLPICVSVCVGHKRQFTTQFTTSSFCPEALLCFYCYTVSHRLASMCVHRAPTCLGEHTISPTASTTRVLAQGRDLARRVPAILIYNITNSVNDARASTGPRPRAARACNSIADAHRRDLVRGLDILQNLTFRRTQENFLGKEDTVIVGPSDLLARVAWNQSRSLLAYTKTPSRTAAPRPTDATPTGTS